MANNRVKRGRVDVDVFLTPEEVFAVVRPRQFVGDHDWNVCECAVCRQRYAQWKGAMRRVRRRLLELEDSDE